jgi:hypothetical protein
LLCNQNSETCIGRAAVSISSGVYVKKKN